VPVFKEVRIGDGESEGEILEMKIMNSQTS
jgi:hypothetical protein